MKQNNQTIPKAIKRGQLLIDGPNDVRLVIRPQLSNPNLIKCYFKMNKTEQVIEFFCIPDTNAIVVE